MNNKYILSTILIVAFILRFYRLGEVPLSLDWDENSNAYNAYSILKTGKDEYGTFLPISNRSFDDYKPPLYMYLNIPAVAIFGLTPFAARLPSAIFGFLTVPIIYFLAKKLFKETQNGRQSWKGSRQRAASNFFLKTETDLTKNTLTKMRTSTRGRETTDRTRSEPIALLAMFFLAVSPWHLQFSRVGFEATVGLFFAVASVTTFLYGLSNKRWLIISGIFLGISAYSYHAERIFVPLIFIATSIVWWREILSISKKYLIAFAAITVVIALPLAILIPPRVILQRFEVTTGRPRLEDIEKSIKLILQDQERGSSIGKYIHNRRLVIGQTYLANYLSHFDFNFLFTKGDDNLRHHIEGMGMLYLFELPLILVGLYLLLKNKNKTSAFILAWLLLAPIPAAPAVPNPHANRALQMIIAFELISAYALVSLLSQKFFLTKIIKPAFAIWVFVSFSIYLHNYWNHYSIDKADFWQYGYQEAVLESENVKGQFEKINVHRSLEQAYIFWLFNTRYDQTTYQKTGNRYNFDKYYFDAKPPTNKNELFISDAGSFPQDFEILETIYYPNGTEAIKIGHPR